MTTDGQICVAGLGGIGGSMARRLHDKGHPVIGVDPDRQRRDGWTADTGRPALPDVTDVDWPIVSHLLVAVRTGEQVLQVLEAAAGTAAGALGLMVISTVPVGFWERVRTVVPDGWRVFEAPVTGGEGQARSGDVAMFLHGRGLPRDREIIADLSNRVVEFAAHGQPASAKLLNNTLAATNAMNVIRALALAARQGMSTDVFIAALNEGSGRSMISQHLGLLSPNQYDLLEKDVGLLRSENPDTELGAGVHKLSSAVREALGDAYIRSSPF